jgi:2'-5' RNA ligase
MENWPTVLVSRVYSKDVLKIHRKLIRILPSSQSQFDGPNFCPHVSLVVRGGEVAAMPLKIKTFGKFKVDELKMVMWDMKSLKRFKVLYSFKLEGNHEKVSK